MREFISHFHPVLVHLPIGILLIAVLFQFLSTKGKYQSLQMAIGIALFWGMMSAIASCISGYLLAQSGEYDKDLIFKHQWLGIITAIVSVVAYFLNIQKSNFTKWIMGLIALLIIITGHLGGSLTHGADYLTEAFSSKQNTKAKLIADVQQAVVYSDIVQPILQTKCYGCHGTSKQKGELRLDNTEFILKGGKDGKIIIAGNVGESEMMNRILLPTDSKKHMPPIEKTQLTKEEINLFHWWISTGADFHKKVNELQQTETIKPILSSLQTGKKTDDISSTDIPTTHVEKADELAIKKLQDRGIVIVPISQNSNYISANFISLDTINQHDIQLLDPLRKQLIWLKLGTTKCTDSAISSLGKLNNLTHLSLEKTLITDASIAQIKYLTQLQYLNVSQTKITAGGLAQLASLKQLKNVFLYKNNIAQNEFANLKKMFPNVVIDTGGYKVEFIASDTVKLKAKK